MFRIKKKPTEPKRKTITDPFGSIDVDGESLAGIEDIIRAQIVARFEGYFVLNGLTIDDYSEIRLQASYGYDGDTETYLYGTRLETDAEFEKRTVSYRKRLAIYKTWYAENKDAVADEIQRREDTARAESAARQEKEITALERKLRKLKNA